MCDSCGYPGDTHYVLSVAYPANRVDGHGEWMTPDTVERAAWEFNTTGREIGLYHDDNGLVGTAQVVESYIYRGPQWQCQAADGSTQTINPGDWLLGVVFPPECWPLVKRGQVDGWSIQGVGARRPGAPGRA
jgi:hypothetical protein